MLVCRLLSVLLFKVVGSCAVKTARLKQLGPCVFAGGSAMVQQGGTLGVDVAVSNVYVSGVLRHRMHVVLTLIYS